MIYAFLGFELDEERFELRREGRALRLEPRALDVLFYLVKNRERVVPKDELIEKLWGVKFVSESALHHSISKVREALAESSNQETIRTVHGRGFRFVAALGEPVESSPAPAPASLNAPAEPPPPAPAVPAGGAPRIRRPWFVPAAALALAAAGGVVLVARSRNGPAPAPASAPAGQPASTGEPRQLTSGLSTAVKPAFSNDGKMLLYVSNDPANPEKLDIYVMSSHGGNAWRLTEGIHPSGDIPVFTADGDEIVFSRRRSGEDGTRLTDLWRVGSMGGPPRLWIAGASGAAFSRDGRLAAFTKHGAGRSPLVLGPAGRPGDAVEIAEPGFVPRFSPDGTSLAYTTSDPNGTEGVLCIRTLATGETRVLTKEPMQMYGLAWLSDNRTLVFAARQHGRFVLWKTSGGADPAPLTLGFGDFSSPSVSPDGETLVFAFASESANLFVADSLAGPASRVTSDEYHKWIRLSPDGLHAVSVVQRAAPEDGLVLTGVKTLRRTKLFSGLPHHPCWAGADRVAFLVDAAGGGTDIVSVSIQTLERRTETRFAFPASWLAVAPGGRRLAVARRSETGGSALVVRDLDRSSDTVLAEGADYQAVRWSADGHALAWSGPREGGSRETNGVWLQREGGLPVRLADDGYGPIFEADGTRVLFTRLGEFAGLWRVPAAGGAAAKLRAFDRGVTGVDVARGTLLWTQDSGRHQIFSLALPR
ncbi:MAG: winged helix-turn-helix domain-containing protein [Acidobacteriota bacterium]